MSSHRQRAGHASTSSSNIPQSSHPITDTHIKTTPTRSQTVPTPVVPQSHPHPLRHATIDLGQSRKQPIEEATGHSIIEDGSRHTDSPIDDLYGTPDTSFTTSHIETYVVPFEPPSRTYHVSQPEPHPAFPIPSHASDWYPDYEQEYRPSFPVPTLSTPPFPQPYPPVDLDDRRQERPRPSVHSHSYTNPSELSAPPSSFPSAYATYDSESNVSTRQEADATVQSEPYRPHRPPPSNEPEYTPVEPGSQRTIDNPVTKDTPLDSNGNIPSASDSHSPPRRLRHPSATIVSTPGSRPSLSTNVESSQDVNVDDNAASHIADDQIRPDSISTQLGTTKPLRPRRRPADQTEGTPLSAPSRQHRRQGSDTYPQDPASNEPRQEHRLRSTTRRSSRTNTDTSIRPTRVPVKRSYEPTAGRTSQDQTDTHVHSESSPQDAQLQAQPHPRTKIESDADTATTPGPKPFSLHQEQRPSLPSTKPKLRQPDEQPEPEPTSVHITKQPEHKPYAPPRNASPPPPPHKPNTPPPPLPPLPPPTRPPLTTEMSGTRYMNMLLALDTIPRLDNMLSSFFTWILLAGFVLFPGTFTSIQNLGQNVGNQTEARVLSTIGHVSL